VPAQAKKSDHLVIQQVQRMTITPLQTENSPAPRAALLEVEIAPPPTSTSPCIAGTMLSK
jgi:hypothetical protein